MFEKRQGEGPDLRRRLRSLREVGDRKETYPSQGRYLQETQGKTSGICVVEFRVSSCEGQSRTRRKEEVVSTAMVRFLGEITRWKTWWSSGRIYVTGFGSWEAGWKREMRWWREEEGMGDREDAADGFGFGEVVTSLPPPPKTQTP